MNIVLGVLGEASLRSAVIAVAVLSVLRLLRVKSPTVLHRAWTSVLAAMLLLPAVSLWGPKIALPLFPPISATTQGKADVQPSAQTLSLSNLFRPAQTITAPDSPVPMRPADNDGHRIGAYEIVILYLAGLVVLLSRLIVGMFMTVRLAHRASRDGQLLYSAYCRAPLCVGLLRPRILLPAESKHWDAAKLEVVLSHERSHAQRRDPLVEWLASLNRCLYWFHPLSWWLRRELTVLAEQACDEAVLRKGYDPAGYAELLLELARSVKRSGALVAVSGASIDGCTLAIRIRRILAGGYIPALSRVRAAVLITLCAAAIVNPAFLTPTRVKAASAIPQLAGKLVGGADSEKFPQMKSPADPSPAFKIPAPFAGPQPTLNKAESKEARTANANATGDSIRSQGGTENPVSAELQFQSHIDASKSPDAQMKIISILMKQMQEPVREQKETARAEAEIRNFLSLYPNSDYAPLVRQYLEEVRLKLAQMDEYVQLNALSDWARKWLQEEVVYIITKEEKAAFLSLRTDEERDRFIEQFWARRNPDPSAANNPAKLEHYRRLAYVNEHFGCGVPGWKSDRGRIYILYGGPDGKEAHPYVGADVRDIKQGVTATIIYPFERWRYDHLGGGGPAEFEFEDQRLDGCFQLVREGRYGGGSLGTGNMSGLQPPSADAEAIIGKWYLVEFSADETTMPDHRMDLVFYAEGVGYRGAVLLRTGVERPLNTVQFDGKLLRFQMMAPNGQSQAETPWFVATLTNGRFEGYYQNSSGAPTGPKLKLVRFPK